VAALNDFDAMSIEERRALARNCFGCGSRNPYGLRLVFEPDGQQVRTTFRPLPEHEGFPGVLHGGIIFTLMDEAMGWATYAQGIMSFSGKVQTRFRKTISTDAALQVIGELVKDRGRTLQMRAEIRSKDGELLADAQGVFVRMPEESVRALELYRQELSTSETAPQADK
jgi:acyl-coenzyme A thioesterase PaaI-like protein